MMASDVPSGGLRHKTALVPYSLFAGSNRELYLSLSSSGDKVEEAPTPIPVPSTPALTTGLLLKLTSHNLGTRFGRDRDLTWSGIQDANQLFARSR